MAKTKKQKGNSFGKVMLIYALLVLALLPAFLRPLWRYLAAYEESGPDKAMERYLDTMDTEHIRALSADFLNGLQLQYQDRDQAFAEVEKLMKGELRFTLKSADTDLRHAVYNIRGGGKVLGTVSMAKEEDPRLGFAPWELQEEHYDFSFLFGEDEITVPSSWQVFCNGIELGEEDLSGEREGFDLLRSFYGDSRFVLPENVTYRISGVVGEAPLRLVDAKGLPVDRDYPLSEEEKLANCTKDEEQEIQTLLDSFVQRYIDCLSNASRDVMGNYRAIKPYIVAGSDIDRIILDNMAGQQWAHSGGDTVTARDDLLLMNLGNGYYLAEFDYTLDTVGNHGHVESVNRIMVVISRTGDGLKVIEVYSL